MIECDAVSLPAISSTTRDRIGIRALALSAAMFGCCLTSVSPAQAQANGTAGIHADIAPATLTLQNTGGLHFGRILPFGRRGHVTVHANGYTLANNAFLLDGSLARAASWQVLGTPGAPYRVVLPASLSVSNGSATMTLSWIFRSGPANLALDANGYGAFTVGAVLDVGANQAPGSYSGTLVATVAYE